MTAPGQQEASTRAKAGRIVDDVTSGVVALAGLALLVAAVGYAHSRVGYWEQLVRVHSWGLFVEPVRTQAWWQELRPYGWRWLLVAATLAQLALLLVARRRLAQHRRQLQAARSKQWTELQRLAVPRAWPEAASLGVLALGLAAAWWHAGSMWPLPHLAKVDLAAATEKEALAFALSWGAISLGIGAVAATLAVVVRLRMATLNAAARHQDGPRKAAAWCARPTPRIGRALLVAATWVLLGLLPFSLAGWLFPLGPFEPPADWKAQQDLLQVAFDSARGDLATGAALLTMSSIFAVLLAWRTWRRAARQRWALLRETDDPAKRWRPIHRGGLVLLGLACGVGAGWLHQLTVPLRSEARDPLPTGYDWRGHACRQDADVPVGGVGPDPLTEAPMVALYRGEIYLDEELIQPDESSLLDHLVRKRELWRQFHPKRVFPGAVVLSLPPVTQLETFASLLKTIHEAGFDDAHLLLVERVESKRRLLGTLCGERGTAVRLRARCPEDATGLSVADYANYSALLNQLRLKRGLGVMPCIAEARPRPTP